MVKRSGADIPVARVNFWTSVDGHRVLIRAGEAWAPDDPVVVGNPGRFESLRIHSSPGQIIRTADEDHPQPTAVV